MRFRLPPYFVPIALALFAMTFTPLGTSCDVAAFAANSTIQVVRRASPSIQRYRDPDFAEEAIPGSIGTMEGLLEIQSGDPTLRMMLARSYASYGFGFLENHLEEAEFRGAEEEEIEHWRFRASAAYLRAREIAVGALDQAYPGDGGIEGARGRGLEAFTQHVSHFSDRENHAPLLFWTAYSWARWIGLHRDDVDAIADLPLVTAIVERVLEIDPTYMDHAPLALRAGLIGSAPEQLGGRPQEAKELFDRAIELTQRRNMMYLVIEARICAIALQDRALYQSLLTEVNEFDVDSVPDSRLQNTLAQRRARRYLQEIDNFFEPEGTAAEEAAPEE
jgi:hypothetical protein